MAPPPWPEVAGEVFNDGVQLFIEENAAWCPVAWKSSSDPTPYVWVAKASSLF